MSVNVNVRKSVLGWISLVLALIVALIVVPRHVSAQKTVRRFIDCNKNRPHTWVISSVDQKHYDVDVCGIVDSAEGEDFRTWVDRPEPKGEN